MKLLIALLPVVFMIHDFEEIIMFKPWLTKNRAALKIRFPKFENFISIKGLFDFSTSVFAVAVLHEFMLVSLATFVSLYLNNYSLWFAAFAAYFVHLLMHVLQWLFYRKYVPVIITSLLTLPYCIYAFLAFIHFTEMRPGQLLLWAMIGVVVTGLSFYSVFSLAGKFHDWENNTLHH